MNSVFSQSQGTTVITVCNRANPKQVTTKTYLSKVVVNLINFFAMPGIRTQTNHLQGDLGVFVLVVDLQELSCR